MPWRVSACIIPARHEGRGYHKDAQRLDLVFIYAAGTLAALGLLVQGGVATQAFPAWDLSQLRYFGVLQRIAACFALASLVVLYIPDSRPLKVHVRPLSLAPQILVVEWCRQLCVTAYPQGLNALSSLPQYL